jgi:small multidrug resistance family-3 protein
MRATAMLETLKNINPIFFLLVATTLEVSGDAIVRMGIYNHAGTYRLALFGVGALLLFGYGSFLNLAPVEFGQVVGLYIATLFVVWQVINFAFFRALPTLPVMTGGSLVVSGGLIITFWKP